MRRASCLALLVVAACGRFLPIDDAPNAAPSLTGKSDGGGSTGVVVDASSAASTPLRRCDPASSFGDFVPVALPSLDLPLGTVRVSSSMGGAGVLALDDGNTHAIRSFQVVGDRITSLGSLGSAYDRSDFFGQAALSSDGRTLVLAQTKDDQHSELLFAHRDEIGQGFPAPTAMTHAGLTDPLYAPYLAGGRVYFSHVPKHGNETLMAGDFDPATGTITNAAEILPAGLFPLLNGDWLLPVVTGDELELFFAHSGGKNDADILHATRPSVNAAFGTPTSIPRPSGSAGYDYPTWISDDGCALWVVSMRGESPAVLLRATRP